MVKLNKIPIENRAADEPQADKPNQPSRYLYEEP